MRQQLSIPEWHTMAQAGSILPMRILIHGGSMYPTVRMDKDYVTIMPLDRPVQVGDIVLFADPRAPRYVLHRVWRLDGDRVLTWGDNCKCPDAWIPLDAVWGRATLVERGKRQIRPDPQKGLRLARVWHRVGGPYRWCKQYYYAVKRRIGRLTKHAGKQESNDGRPPKA